MGCPTIPARRSCSASRSPAPPSSADSIPPPASRHRSPTISPRALLAISTSRTIRPRTDGARQPRQPARRRATQTPSRNPARRDRARRAHQRWRADHLPRPGQDGGRVDRLPLPLTAAQPRRATARRTATHATPPPSTSPRPDPPASQSNVVRRSPPNSPNSSATTAPRSLASKPRSQPPKARTSNYGASSAAKAGRPPPEPITRRRLAVNADLRSALFLPRAHPAVCAAEHISRVISRNSVFACQLRR